MSEWVCHTPEKACKTGWTEKGALKDKIWELKFNDGRRIYYAYIPEKNILLLLGGNKNGQEKDINKAKKLFIEKTKSTSKGK